MGRNVSLQQPIAHANTLQAHRFASIVRSDDAIQDDRRSQISSKAGKKKVDYSDISLQMI